ncbi:branched-chain amino acid ABC transporter permease [Megalodesulfovibrio gigas]|uniref:Putative inner-membrane translocator n=1 Tax=Megalodesulfovibrio gigas (strain ATCC 19364 / DSM 1382 / NCIMB 9332 / VKM B-1759) TaxID=1121448 RepID=T2GE31_MEGG1|nr:branched-chain amino acid ABC transporter permease [Megalodesulfovibrio gigas]AGW14850.1 putative inner-membrane translocator [Megalodesulfovibrio gigas DSM 1382 = ATCC 19364]
MLSSLLQYLLTGLTVGATYGLTGLGFTIIYNTTSIINFAQGEFVMLGGMLAVALMTGLDWPLIPAILGAMAGTTLAGVLMHQLTIRPVRRAEALQYIIITIGVSILIRGIAMLVFGKDTFALPQFTGNTPLSFLGASVMPQNLWVLGVTAVLLLLMKLFFDRTIHGKAMLACSVDPKAASLVGVSVRKMAVTSFALSAFVGAVGGVILAPITLTSYDRGIMLGLKGFAACIVGGLGNPFGAAAGGIALGILESVGAGYISSGYKDAFAFLALLVLLFVKPSGLFGKAAIKRV